MPRRGIIEPDFAPEGALSAHAGIRRLGWMVSLLVVTLIGGFIFWAANAPLDEVTRGDGRVIPSQRIQVIQNLEGGIVSEILVREGQIVPRDAVLVRIANTAAEAQSAAVGRERRGGMPDDRGADRQRLANVEVKVERGVLAVAQLDDAGHAHEVDARLEVEAADDRRTRDDQDRKVLVLLDQEMGDRPTAPQMAEAHRVVRIDEYARPRPRGAGMSGRQALMPVPVPLSGWKE